MSIVPASMKRFAKSGLVSQARYLSDYLDPLYPRRKHAVDDEWVQLAKKQLKGEDPLAKLTWNTAEVGTIMTYYC